ncbi:hypothetical protein Q9189_005879 [Teloschistes chrysophthalmus]
MVKADPKCDYYADLEVSPAADALEIKKSFKKLDRNPGHELEFNSKFQAIQSAHEVLTDPQQRAKYDADRIRFGSLHTYNSSSVRPNPPPRAAASNFPPPPRRTAQTPTGANFPPPPSSGASRFSTYMRTDPNGANKCSADEAKARANAFEAWKQMRHSQGVPPQARPVPPRPTKTGAFQPGREAGSYPPKDPSPRTTWDQSKEAQPTFPKMARSNTTRVPKKGGFAPGFSTVDEPPARNTSAYFNMSKGERPDISRPAFESRPPPPPPPAATSQKATSHRPDPIKSWRTQQGTTDDPFTSSERISTPYATSGGEKTYFTSSELPRSANSRERPSSNDYYDSEPMEEKDSQSKHAGATSQRGHRSASPKFRHNRPVSISSTSSSSSSDESLREGVEQLYTSAGSAQTAHNRTQTGHLRPNYKPFLGADAMEEDHGLHPRSRSDAADSPMRFAQGPVDGSQTEGFMEHRMKHEAERTQGTNNPVASPPQSNGSDRSQQRPLHRPKSWHERYGANGRNQAEDHSGRPATGDQSAKASMYDENGFDPYFFTPSPRTWSQQWPFGGSKPSKAAGYPKMSIPGWAIPSSIPPSKPYATEGNQATFSKSRPSILDLMSEDADMSFQRSFTFPNSADGQRAHAPPLRSHSSDTISVNFSPSDWNGKFTAKPGESFEPPSMRAPAARGRTSPTKRRAPPVQPASSTARSEMLNGNTDMGPPPVPADRNTEYSPDKWAPYFKPGTLNWPPPPPPAGTNTRGISKKRPKTPSRRGSRPISKRPAVPKSANVAAHVGDASDESPSSTSAEISRQTSGSGSAMDLDTSLSPPSTVKQTTPHKSPSVTDAKEATPRPPIPPRPTAPPQVHPPQQDSHFNLENLRNVAPFAPNQEGIADLNDLNTSLPFESKASTSAAQPSDPHNQEHQPLKPRDLHIPPAPKPPTPPPSQGPPLTQAQWTHYLNGIRAYMFEWNAYNHTMLSHFNERQSHVDANMKLEWWGAVGEEGFLRHVAGVEEDSRVREHWDRAWVAHRECLKALGEVRGQVLGRGG